MSIIVVGADCQLGSSLIRQLSKTGEPNLHLILTSQSTSSATTTGLSEELDAAGRSHSWHVLDLDSFSSVRAFVLSIQEPTISALIHTTSPECAVDTAGARLDRAYQHDVLAPVLLMRLLAPKLSGGIVILTCSRLHQYGDYGYFWRSHNNETPQDARQCHFGEMLKRQGSADLLLLIAAKALQDEFPNTRINSVELPMHNDFPVIKTAAESVLGSFAPLVQFMTSSCDAVAERSATAIVRLLEDGRENLSGHFLLSERRGSLVGRVIDMAFVKAVLKRLEQDIKDRVLEK